MISEWLSSVFGHKARPPRYTPTVTVPFVTGTIHAALNDFSFNSVGLNLAHEFNERGYVTPVHLDIIADAMAFFERTLPLPTVPPYVEGEEHVLVDGTCDTTLQLPPVRRLSPNAYQFESGDIIYFNNGRWCYMPNTTPFNHD